MAHLPTKHRDRGHPYYLHAPLRWPPLQTPPKVLVAWAEHNQHSSAIHEPPPNCLPFSLAVPRALPHRLRRTYYHRSPPKQRDAIRRGQVTVRLCTPTMLTLPWQPSSPPWQAPPLPPSLLPKKGAIVCGGRPSLSSPTAAPLVAPNPALTSPRRASLPSLCPSRAPT